MSLRPALLAVLAAILLAGLAPPAHAQGAAPTTYWLHINADVDYWVNDVQDDPAGDGATGGYNALGFVLGEPAVAEWSIPFQPALAAPVPLDPAGQMVSTIYIGGNSAAGRVTVTSELRLGTTVVATATAAAATVYSAGYQKVELTAPLQAAALDPTVGDPTWVIQAEGAGAQIFLSATTDRWTQFTLPVLAGAGGPEVREHDLTGEVAEFTLEPSVPANATHIYHWATTLSALRLTVDGNATAGNATITVRDGGNTTVHTRVFDGSAGSADLTGAAGNWTIQVDLAGFAGKLDVRLGAPAPSPSGTGTTTTTSTNRPSGQPTATDTSGTSGADGNATSDGDGDKGAPGPALPLVLGALAVVVLAGRRRA